MLFNASIRRMILKIPYARELTNYYVNVANSIYYKQINKTEHFDDKLLAMRNSHFGQRCFIVGNGPSLNIDHLDKLVNEYTFCANEICKLFDYTEWRPNYYLVNDAYNYNNIQFDTLDVDCLFISDFYWRHNGMRNKNAICIHTRRELSQKRIKKLPFSDNIASFIQVAGTVTYLSIQIAAYMGFTEIYLIGMDHCYPNEVNDNGKIIKKNKVIGHVFEDDKPEEVVANISYMEMAYEAAKEYCDNHGISIYNATKGGHLEVFRRVEFDSLFS